MKAMSEVFFTKLPGKQVWRPRQASLFGSRAIAPSSFQACHQWPSQCICRQQAREAHSRSFGTRAFHQQSLPLFRNTKQRVSLPSVEKPRSSLILGALANHGSVVNNAFGSAIQQRQYSIETKKNESPKSHTEKLQPDRPSDPGSTKAGSDQDVESIASSVSKYLHLNSLPHRPTKDELLAAANGFWERFRVRFKWMSIRSMRPWNADEWGAFVSWFMLGHIVWVLVGTTTFFSILIFSINTVFAQGKSSYHLS